MTKKKEDAAVTTAPEQTQTPDAPPPDVQKKDTPEQTPPPDLTGANIALDGLKNMYRLSGRPAESFGVVDAETVYVDARVDGEVVRYNFGWDDQFNLFHK